MRSDPEALTRLIRPVVQSLGYELLGVELLQQHKRGGLLRVYIDRDDGITLDDCGRVSHQLSGVLDVDDPIRGNYDLEVSSPGLDRPLFTQEHFQQFKGHEVRLELRTKIEGRRRFRGVLDGFEDGNVLLTADGESHHFPLEQVESARLIPEF